MCKLVKNCTYTSAWWSNPPVCEVMDTQSAHVAIRNCESLSKATILTDEEQRSLAWYWGLLCRGNMLRQRWGWRSLDPYISSPMAWRECSAAWHSSLQCGAFLCNAVCNVVQCGAIQCNAVQFSAMRCSRVCRPVECGESVSAGVPGVSWYSSTGY